jgi:GntR family transcriptional regulator
MLLHLSEILVEPLHAQISRQIRAKILSDTLEEGTALPSIRVMAREQHVSVITVQRAYDDLQREGLLHSKKGKGLFVAHLTNEKKKGLANGRFKKTVVPIIQGAIESGVN